MLCVPQRSSPGGRNGNASPPMPVKRCHPSHSSPVASHTKDNRLVGHPSGPAQRCLWRATGHPIAYTGQSISDCQMATAPQRDQCRTVPASHLEASCCNLILILLLVLLLTFRYGQVNRSSCDHHPRSGSFDLRRSRLKYMCGCCCCLSLRSLTRCRY